MLLPTLSRQNTFGKTKPSDYSSQQKLGDWLYFLLSPRECKGIAFGAKVNAWNNLMTLGCHAKEVARLMGLAAGLFLVRTPRSPESWPRSLLQALCGSMNFPWQDSDSKGVNITKGWKQTEGLPHLSELPSRSLTGRARHLLSPPCPSSKRRVAQPLLVHVEDVRNWKNTLYFYTVHSEKLKRYTGLHWSTPFQLYIL